MPLTFRLSALNFLQNIAFACGQITIGTYMLQRLDFSGREIGLVYATTAIAATITPPLMGWLADYRFRVEQLLIVLNLLAAAALAACFYATEFWLFYVLMLGYNLCFMPTFSLVTSLCFHQLENPARQYPPVRVWGTVSFMMVGLGLSYFVLEDTAYPLMIASAACVMTAVLCLTMPATPPQPGFKLSMLKGPEVKRLFAEPGMIVLLLGMLVYCIPSAFYYSFVNPFLNEVGWSAAAAKMSLGQLVEIGVVLLMPLVFRKLRFRRIFFWGLLVWGLRYLAFGIGRPGGTEWLLYFGIMVQGIAFAWVVIAAQIYIDNRVPIFLRSTAQGLISFANQGFGLLIGSLIAGEVVLAHTTSTGGHDWWSIWLVPGVVGTVAALAFWAFFPKRGEINRS
ncbi:MAG: MFS transporter, partial [Bacteroidota bacterium]